MTTAAGKKAVVTGGTGTIGLAIARLLLARGAEVVLTGRNQARLDAARDALASPAVHVVRSDAANMNDIDALAAFVHRTFGQIDAVLVNHGVFESWKPMEQVTEVSYDRHFDANTKGAYFTVQRLVPLVRDGGAVVFTTVTHSLGYSNSSVYSGSKEAVWGFAKAFAAELLPRRIRVNCVAPGYIKSTVKGDQLSDELQARLEREGVETTPLGRLGTAEEVAVSALFLAFDATYTTGAELLVDGGVGGCLAAGTAQKTTSEDSDHVG
ncbi:SDR family oxidoreductase [Streptoalloteichus hindustanus]|uniref:NAD(P)-dependent dehydrogenase, short-chain alcohol dehydrogenase family n=1 Tax=Streptoalloteichus hindustanus TaxID=2017 RepID=A0A1M5CGT4_STRHI|nr:SDR family oxidoreductase [Streptoalloteichus hindustanus]SHF53965.1 NAD(P)-dependent dehydrogenase, short-chain alcohol dehydrogenase family [Streptoalloteichus hindustanus]